MLPDSPCSFFSFSFFGCAGSWLLPGLSLLAERTALVPVSVFLSFSLSFFVRLTPWSAEALWVAFPARASKTLLRRRSAPAYKPLVVQASHCRACLVVKLGFCGALALVAAASGLYSTGSTVLVHGLSYSVACGVCWDHGLNPCLLHWRAESLPLSHQGKNPTLILCSFVNLPLSFLWC